MYSYSTTPKGEKADKFGYWYFFGRLIGNPKIAFSKRFQGVSKEASDILFRFYKELVNVWYGSVGMPNICLYDSFPFSKMRCILKETVSRDRERV